MLPEKINAGDEIRIIAPARSAGDIDEVVIARAQAALESLSLKVSFSQYAFSRSQRGCPTDVEKVDDLHAAFLDPNVKGILAAIGGFNSNQLLGRIDWDIIRANPKIFAGFSDITVLNHAILAKTGLVTFATPNFYCFGLPPKADYSLEYFRRCLFAGQPETYRVRASKVFYDYGWYYDEKSPRSKIVNGGLKIIQPGQASGTLLGGNLCSLNLLNGTEYFPCVEGDIILCLEDDSYDSIPETFERNLQSLIQQPYFRQVKAILFGRFQRESIAS
jgi:putative carboxypeptidase yocD